jgi:23S rRNA-/tRNA-specific pseudouridylate synthase
MSVEVLYQDEYIAAYFKPPLVHSVPGVNPGSFVEELKTQNILNDFGKDHPEAGIINRLDFETSGVILAAKTKDSYEKLRLYTKQNLIQKNYIFLSDKTIDRKTACELSIGARNRKSDHVQARLVSRDKDRTTAARTLFSKIASTNDSSLHLLEAVIYQGQRHQIRVHAKHIGCPLINDVKYGGSELANVPDNIFILHNSRCEFTHPFSGLQTVIWAKFDSKILNFLNNFNWTWHKELDAKTDSKQLSDFTRQQLIN